MMIYRITDTVVCLLQNGDGFDDDDFEDFGGFEVEF